VLHLGRTCLQDAQPMKLGQLFGGYAALTARLAEELLAARAKLCVLPLGGTAIGTGFGAPLGYRKAVFDHLAKITGTPFEPPENSFDAMQNLDAMSRVSAELRTCAASLGKIAADLILLSSGPAGGLGEIRLPAVQAGSSIMPGKVNPTQCETLTMAALQVFGHDATVALAASRGSLELNVYKPVIIQNLLAAVRILSGAVQRFTEHGVAGLEIDRARIDSHLHGSLMLVTALVPRIGYDQAAKAALTAHREGISLREACARLGLLTPPEFDAAVRPEEMTRPGAGQSAASG